jgi:hypothetical protein
MTKQQQVFLVSLEKVVESLGVDRNWLMKWLRHHPCDEAGVPFYRFLGRTKLFSADDCMRLYKALGKKPAQKPAAEAGFVYFVVSGDFIKIGFSRSIDERMFRFATDSPLPVELLHFEPGTFKTEKIVHKHFAHLRARGEWFRKTQELLDYIEQRKEIFKDKEDGL